MATIVICDKCGKRVSDNILLGTLGGKIVTIENCVGFGNKYNLCDKCAKEVEDFIKSKKE